MFSIFRRIKDGSGVPHFHKEIWEELTTAVGRAN